jgi:RNA polymerase sigma factor (sigma-70 family)
MLSGIVLRTQSDETLAQLAARSSEPAFEAIVQRYRRPLLGYCRRLLLSESHSEDVVQQTFLNAWTALRRHTDVRDVKPWLYRITHNQAMSALRRPGWDFAELNESLLNRNQHDNELDGRIVMRETLAAVAALPGMQREVILRTAIEGRSYEEVAGDLGVSEESIRGLVYRARASLRAGFAVFAPEGLVLWAAGLTRRCASSRWLPELLSGGGSAGGAAVVVKGAAVIASSAAVIGGTVGFVFKPHPADPSKTRHANVAHRVGHARAPVRFLATTGPSDRRVLGRPVSAARPGSLSVHGPASKSQHLHLVAAAPAGHGSSRGTVRSTGSRQSRARPAASSQPDRSQGGSKIPMQGNARTAVSPPSGSSASAPASTNPTAANGPDSGAAGSRP